MIDGTPGNDIIGVGLTSSNDDIVFGLGGDDFIDGLAGNDLLYGDDGDDTLVGGEGEDRLFGGLDTDTMTGGTGNDWYYLDNTNDQVIEDSDAGLDTVLTTLANYTLGASVEVLRFIGTGDFVGTGNDLDNRVVGGAGNDTLVGGAGNDWLVGWAGGDTMTGGSGDDGYYVDDVGDVVVEAAGEGTDEVRTTLAIYVLASEVEWLRFVGVGDFDGTGNDLANVMLGGDGTDTLNGGLGDDRLNGLLGADTMIGGGGNDTFQVDNLGDVVVEGAGDGSDTIYSSVNYSLAPGVRIETLRVLGSAGLTLTGNARDNVLIGAAGDDTLDSGTGNDRINGYGGSDILSTSGASATIYGGEGNDTIRLDGSSTSSGLVDGGDGIDTVRSADLGEFAFRNVEVLDTYYGFLSGSLKQLSSFSGFTADLAAPDTQISFTLRGAGGILDFTTGIGGDNSVEIRDGGITSAIVITGSTNGDTLFGSAFRDTLNGGNGDDVLFGNEARDTLNGGADNDRLGGGTGNDVLTGGTGNDTFVFDTPIDAGDNRDRITDFTPGSDTFEINQENYFQGLAVGQLDPAQFAVGTATGVGPQIVYNAVSGLLFYDVNGAGAGGASQFAVLTGAPALTASDFLVV